MNGPMTHTTKPRLLIATLLTSAVLASQPALAQNYGYRDTLLVTPQGDILDYVPERGEVEIGYDRLGRRVLFDHRGNLIATEVPAETYFPQNNAREYPTDNQQVSNQGWNDDNVVTGGVPPQGRVDSQPLDQVYPDISDEQRQVYEEPAPMATDQATPRTVTPEIPVGKLARAEATALQVFLDREGISPGVIDGKIGQNVNKAIVAWEQMTGEKLDPNNADEILERLRLSGGLAFTSYTITAGDAAGPYVAEIPTDYSQKAMLPSLAFTSTAEMLAEKFHMDEDYLRELNPGVDFTIPGTIIKVIDPGAAKKGQVARIVADKGLKQVFAYNDAGGLIAAYPASIGSTDTPSPSGTVTVDRIALNPGYTYNPKINFQQGGNDKVLNIPPGPNGPVGVVWMALSKPTYGIHGTPDPSKIGRTQSHGCIRLTNWDATELAKMSKPGVTVEFVD